MSEKEIRFINSRYQELFRIPDGGTIQITYPDRQFSAKCEYLDEYHTRIGGNVYHICQFAELLEQGGGTCKPEPRQSVEGNDRLSSPDRLKVFLDSPKDAYAILQLRYTRETDMERFVSLASLHRVGLEPNFVHYRVVYTAPLSAQENQSALLESLFTQFNIAHPVDFTGHSLSVSDVVGLKQNGVVSFHYVDSIGFRELPEFFRLENYLKNAEMLQEDDYDMIDGILNNGRSAAAEERPSVLKRLREERPAPEHPSKPARQSKEPER